MILALLQNAAYLAIIFKHSKSSQMKNSKQILDLIKSFDSTYMMSDDRNAYSEGKRQEQEIHTALENADNDTLIEVRNSLDFTDRFINVPFGKYFEGLTEPTSKPQSKLSKIMSTAWELFRTDLFESFGIALKAAWAKYKLIERLKASVVRFSFVKADSTIREAIGTLRDGNFEYQSKGSPKKENPNIIKYFDVVSNGFRSCRVDRLIAA